MICSGLCFLLFIGKSFCPCEWLDSHNTWINFWGARHSLRRGVLLYQRHDA